MEVTLLFDNKDEIINKLYVACRTCYTAGTPQEQYLKVNEVSEEKKLKLIKHVLDSGHHSTLEHVQLTFLLSGMSRATSHQWVRHRHASISQQSQRYVEFKDGNFDFVIPKSISSNLESQEKFLGLMNKISEAYNFFINCGIPAEDARSVLPNACTTNMTWSCNLRELIHICNERLCSCAQAEVRKMTYLMVKEVKKILPFMDSYLVPKCEMLGYCNESKTRTCGRKVLKSDIIKADTYVLSSV